LSETPPRGLQWGIRLSQDEKAHAVMQIDVVRVPKHRPNTIHIRRTMMALAVYARRAAFLAPVLRIASASAPSAASLAATTASRGISSTCSTHGIEEFFGKDLLSGEAKPSGAYTRGLIFRSHMHHCGAYEQAVHGRHPSCAKKALKICMLFGLCA